MEIRNFSNLIWANVLILIYSFLVCLISSILPIPYALQICFMLSGITTVALASYALAFYIEKHF